MSRSTHDSKESAYAAAEAMAQANTGVDFVVFRRHGVVVDLGMICSLDAESDDVF